MRKTNVDALIKRAEEQLSVIRSEYDKSLHKRAIEASLRIDIKNLCENLRSVLDYIAHDIREKYCPSAKSGDRFYFPILPDLASFTSMMNKWFPGLDKSSGPLWNLLQTVQPYQPKCQWLGLFNRLNNENKHGDLVEQIRNETQQVKVQTQGGGTVSWNPSAVRFGAGVYIGGVPVDPATQMPVPHESQKVEKITWVDFRFAGLDVSAIALLVDAVSGVKDISARVYGVL